MDENNTTGAHETLAPSKQNLAVPIAIVIAGLAIAAAIFFGNGQVLPPRVPSGNNDIANIQVDPITATDHILGSVDAKVVVVEYSDTECPFCKVFHPTLVRIMDEYGKNGEVAWVYRHFPLPIHPKAPHEAEATECANKLGGNTKFWAYLDRIFEITPGNNQLDPAELPKIAAFVGLDVAAFNTCLASGEMKPTIEKDAQSGVRAGLQGTPYSIILVNKKVVDTINGAEPYESVKAKITSALKK